MKLQEVGSNTKLCLLQTQKKVPSRLGDVDMGALSTLFATGNGDHQRPKMLLAASKIVIWLYVCMSQQG